MELDGFVFVVPSLDHEGRGFPISISPRDLTLLAAGCNPTYEVVSAEPHEELTIGAFGVRLPDWPQGRFVVRRQHQ